ncbi:MAG: hypothetical protein JXQ99_29265 [Hyphomicrobiaceae bacterium]
MTDQLLWLETLLKGSIGLIMLITPLTAAKLAGLPHGNTAFWPRLFGAALLAIAAAFAFEGYTQLNPKITANGIGLGGAVIINFVTTLSLIGTIILKGVTTRRGLVLLWSLSLALIFLTLFEIANA